MGLFDLLEKTDLEKRLEKKHEPQIFEQPATAEITEATTQPGQTSGSLGPSESSESPGPSGASGSSGWPGYGPQVPPSPCRSCGTPAAWELVYDGSLHCPECEPPPGRALVRRWWTIWLRPRRPNDGPIQPGFATSRFSGVGLTPEWIEMDAPRRF